MRLAHRWTRREFVVASLAGLAGLACKTSAEALQEARPDADAQLLDLTATDAVVLLRSGDLLAEHYARALLSQCEKQRQLNAFIFLDEARVMDARCG